MMVSALIDSLKGYSMSPRGNRFYGKKRSRQVGRYLESGLSIQQLIAWIESLADDSETRNKNLLKFRDAIADLVAYGEAAVDPLIESLSHAQKSWMVWVATSVLEKIGDPRAVEPLRAIYVNNRGNIDNQIHLLHALSHLKDAHLFEILVPLLNHEDKWLRQSVIRDLGILGDLRAVEILVSLLHHESTTKDQTIKSMLLGALGALGNQQALEALIGQIPKANLYQLSTIIRVLGEIGGLQAVQALESIINKPDVYSLQASRYDRLRCDAVNAVAHIRHPASREVLQAALGHRKRGVRRRARIALESTHG
jgi:HEAT repeat protein